MGNSINVVIKLTCATKTPNFGYSYKGMLSMKHGSILYWGGGTRVVKNLTCSAKTLTCLWVLVIIF